MHNPVGPSSSNSSHSVSSTTSSSSTRKGGKGGRGRRRANRAQSAKGTDLVSRTAHKPKSSKVIFQEAMVAAKEDIVKLIRATNTDRTASELVKLPVFQDFMKLCKADFVEDKEFYRTAKRLAETLCFYLSICQHIQPGQPSCLPLMRLMQVSHDYNYLGEIEIGTRGKSKLVDGLLLIKGLILGKSMILAAGNKEMPDEPYIKNRILLINHISVLTDEGILDPMVLIQVLAWLLPDMPIYDASGSLRSLYVTKIIMHFQRPGFKSLRDCMFQAILDHAVQVSLLVVPGQDRLSKDNLLPFEKLVCFIKAMLNKGVAADLEHRLTEAQYYIFAAEALDILEKRKLDPDFMRQMFAATCEMIGSGLFPKELVPRVLGLLEKNNFYLNGRSEEKGINILNSQYILLAFIQSNAWQEILSKGILDRIYDLANKMICVKGGALRNVPVDNQYRSLLVHNLSFLCSEIIIRGKATPQSLQAITDLLVKEKFYLVGDPALVNVVWNVFLFAANRGAKISHEDMNMVCQVAIDGRQWGDSADARAQFLAMVWVFYVSSNYNLNVQLKEGQDRMLFALATNCLEHAEVVEVIAPCLHMINTLIKNKWFPDEGTPAYYAFGEALASIAARFLSGEYTKLLADTNYLEQVLKLVAFIHTAPEVSDLSKYNLSVQLLDNWMLTKPEYLHMEQPMLVVIQNVIIPVLQKNTEDIKYQELANQLLFQLIVSLNMRDGSDTISDAEDFQLKLKVLQALSELPSIDQQVMQYLKNSMAIWYERRQSFSEDKEVRTAIFNLWNALDQPKFKAINP